MCLSISPPQASGSSEDPRQTSRTKRETGELISPRALWLWAVILVMHGGKFQPSVSLGTILECATNYSSFDYTLDIVYFKNCTLTNYWTMSMLKGKRGAHCNPLKESEWVTIYSLSVSGLVGLVNVGNSCYMNATLQALSNWLVDQHPLSRVASVRNLHVPYRVHVNCAISIFCSDKLEDMYIF